MDKYIQEVQAHIAAILVEAAEKLGLSKEMLGKIAFGDTHCHGKDKIRNVLNRINKNCTLSDLVRMCCLVGKNPSELLTIGLHEAEKRLTGPNPCEQIRTKAETAPKKYHEKKKPEKTKTAA